MSAYSRNGKINAEEKGRTDGVMSFRDEKEYRKSGGNALSTMDNR